MYDEIPETSTMVRYGSFNRVGSVASVVAIRQNNTIPVVVILE